MARRILGVECPTLANNKTNKMKMTYKEAENKIKELADKKFLIKLTEIGRLYGWSGDYVEIGRFIEAIHCYAEVEVPIIEPYELTEG